MELFLPTITYGQEIVQLMTKGRIFNKINNVPIVGAFKNVFQRRNDKVLLLPDVLKDA